jgi:D-sedoheptulose 7-phosphate isomerase
METIVFTNGCFDILHPGHIDLLERARQLGTKLIVGINSDSSVRAIKGPDRPVLNAEARKRMLLALRPVDEVIIFDELTPEKLIHEIKPDVLVKGGDWKTSEIIGADFVIGRGGKVVSLPLLDGFGSTAIIDSLKKPKQGNADRKVNGTAAASINQHLEVFSGIRHNCLEAIEKSAAIITETLKNGGKILICGNGGSAADAQHLAAEFVGRYEAERRALPAIALTTDTSALTAIANDYSFERVFSRQVESLAKPGDCLIAISTSGNSPNVIAAVMEARRLGCKIVGLTGGKGKKLASLCDACVLIPSERTARIQEGHITVAHIWCEIVDSEFHNQATLK